MIDTGDDDSEDDAERRRRLYRRGTAVSGCTVGAAMGGPIAVTVSHDNRSVYVASQNSNAVAVFDRDLSTGALTQKSSTDACVSDTGAGGCFKERHRARRRESVAVSPNDQSVYVTGWLKRFDRRFRPRYERHERPTES